VEPGRRQLGAQRVKSPKRSDRHGKQWHRRTRGKSNICTAGQQFKARLIRPVESLGWIGFAAGSVVAAVGRVEIERQ